MDNFEEAIRRTNELTEVAQVIISFLNKSEGFIDSARSLLATFDDPSARAVIAELNDCLDAVRNVSCGFGKDYLNIGHELVHTLGHGG